MGDTVTVDTYDRGALRASTLEIKWPLSRRERKARYHERVLVQDRETGKWHLHFYDRTQHCGFSYIFRSRKEATRYWQRIWKSSALRFRVQTWTWDAHYYDPTPTTTHLRAA